ncbi:putative dehydrogenase, with GroES-like domain [Frankia alni ACN14a]|uniref:Dehydrogenase, with GroES-like domain n=3 Tax=Frankiaceae TaxID=74712 RepID=Q0RIM8_FRAAA|nr:putative dehydrogenase, with GroES-like domain [Frankia alni ACN14a]
MTFTHAEAPTVGDMSASTPATSSATEPPQVTPPAPSSPISSAPASSSPASSSPTSSSPVESLSAPAAGRLVRLAAYPVGLPAPEDFRVELAAVPAPRPGQVVVRTTLFALDAAARLFLGDVGLPLPRLTLGDVVPGAALGEVVASTDPGFAVGDEVCHQLGWREFAVADAAALRRVDPAVLPTPTAYLAPLLTAWAGLVAAAELRSGDTVFVSGAAGAVGGLAGQIARLRGAGRVIGSAGSPAKVAHVTGTLGFDAAFDHRDGPVLDRLRECAPEGIDVYFDNTGGAQLAAAVRLLRPHGRVVLCGLLDRQTGPRPGRAAGEETTPDLGYAIANRLTLRGLRTADFADRRAEAEQEIGHWLATGRLQLDETIVDGIENAPRAFTDLLRGAFTGRVVIRVDGPGM